MTILVVDDESAVRELVSEILRRAGYDVVAAASGEEALEALADGAVLARPFTADAPAPALTPRELSVLELLAEGCTYDEIGLRLAIGAETVRTHLRKACEHLGAPTRTSAVAVAIRLGLI